ncbi:hypothetical protein L7F22_044690 [Adiantum nelumboides]|nr:hypothetical protein [Adiantum nelumboides]
MVVQELEENEAASFVVEKHVNPLVEEQLCSTAHEEESQLVDSSMLSKKDGGHSEVLFEVNGIPMDAWSSEGMLCGNVTCIPYAPLDFCMGAALQGIDVRPISVDVAKFVDVAGPSTRIAAARSVLPTVDQARWDVKDAQAHALIALSVNQTITPNICSAKSAKQAWDILAGLYAGRNEAKIALLCKELESKIMNEEDMDTFLACIKDINEQLISTGEIISDSFLVQTVLDAL